MCFGTVNKFDVHFNGKLIEQVPRYKYLGTIVRCTKRINQEIFLENSSFICDKSRKSIFGLQKKVKFTKILPPEIQLEMFDTMIKPNHYPLYHFDDISEPKNEPTDRVIRLINIKTVNEFVQRIEKENWDHIYNVEDPQEAYSRFSNLLRRHYCESFPKIMITGKYRNRLPWLTEGLKTSIRHKNKLYKLSVKKPLLMNVANYERYRNKVNHLIKIAEKLHHQEMFQENKNNLTKTWSLIKNIIWKNKYTKSCGQFLDGNYTITDKAKISNMFNNFFTNIGVNLANQIPKSNHGPRKYLEGSYLHSMFFQTSFTNRSIHYY